MSPVLPNPFHFEQQQDIDMLCLQAIAGALKVELPEPPVELPVFLDSPRVEFLDNLPLRANPDTSPTI